MSDVWSGNHPFIRTPEDPSTPKGAVDRFNSAITAWARSDSAASQGLSQEPLAATTDVRVLIKGPHAPAAKGSCPSRWPEALLASGFFCCPAELGPWMSRF